MGDGPKSADGRALVRSGQRSYELAEAPEAVLELLRTRAGLPGLSEQEARRALDRKPFIQINDDCFALYKPWRRRVYEWLGEETEVGPAVFGRVTPTPRGARLEVRVRRYAPTPGQLGRLLTGAAWWLLPFVAIIAFAGPNPLLLSFFGGIAAAVLGSVLLFRRRERNQDIRELLAIVEGALGPLELPAGPDPPHRRSASELRGLSSGDGSRAKGDVPTG